MRRTFTVTIEIEMETAVDISNEEMAEGVEEGMNNSSFFDAVYRGTGYGGWPAANTVKKVING